MAKVRLGDVVDHIKDKVDKDATDLEYYVGGEHIDGDEITVQRKGKIQGSTIGPAFHTRFMNFSFGIFYMRIKICWGT